MSTALLAAGLTVRLVASHGYAEGAPPGFAGGFKDDTCHACHFHQPLDTASGRLVIDGAPERYTPGERYTLTVKLTRTGMTLAGFQLSARFRDSGAQAGSLATAPDDGARVGVETQAGVQYAGQKKAGSDVPAAGSAAWTVVWTAPASGGPVTLNVSANAADGDGTVEGDFIHTATLDVLPRPAERQ